MNHDKSKLKQLFYAGLLVFAFLAGMFVATYKFYHKDILAIANVYYYNNYIGSAANYAQCLLDIRKGNTNAVINRLEKCLDVNLLILYDCTNSVPRVIVTIPWDQVKADREQYPRVATNPERERRINAMLDFLLKENELLSKPAPASSVNNTNTDLISSHSDQQEHSPNPEP